MVLLRTPVVLSTAELLGLRLLVWEDVCFRRCPMDPKAAACISSHSRYGPRFRPQMTQAAFSRKRQSFDRASHLEISAIAGLFPSEVAAVACHLPCRPHPLHPAEEQLAARYHGRRLEDFMAGRHCAREALATIETPEIAILAADDGAPIWPEGVLGSLTHTDGFCAAAVALQEDAHGIGLDAESGRLPRASWPLICSPTEIAFIEREPDYIRTHVATIIFSAKEALFKCRYLITAGGGFDFRDVSLRLGQGRFEIAPDSLVSLQSGSFNGRFCLCNRLVLTAAWWRS
jgi:4'-phosphopantetheinyl transferase EntD